ncbi:hypothetical protein SQ03_05995 [Methylobacterium platani JCM 14648]|uniref:Uncharacterized protein n=2 Tax=Methylobacterium platani TaxID=427683 RepID=A0A179SBD8_9HYPH|nr:hypothetical protein SQ03_05995 [Methylobacterium platani JCM 14648]OAS24087.1 hypothetical protein A5481_15075 [Methylobacterium platani]
MKSVAADGSRMARIVQPTIIRSSCLFVDVRAWAQSARRVIGVKTRSRSTASQPAMSAMICRSANSAAS